MADLISSMLAIRICPFWRLVLAFLLAGFAGKLKPSAVSRTGPLHAEFITIL
jgi:hypothetical protein